MTITHLLTTNAVVLAVSMTALWAYCVRIKDVSVIDSFWSFVLCKVINCLLFSTTKRIGSFQRAAMFKHS